MKKKLLAMMMCCAMLAATLAGCGSKETASDAGGTAEEATAVDAGTTEEAAAADTTEAAGETAQSESGGEQYKIGFAIKTLEGAFFVKLAEAVQKECESAGWECVTLNADRDIQKEAENMETFIAQKMDLIILDCVEPTAASSVVESANEAGIPVIALDAGVSDDTPVVTTVYSNNKQIGRQVGLAYAKKMADEKITAIILSGAKGDVVGYERRLGAVCGIIEEKTKISEEQAWEEAQKMEDELIKNGKAENADAGLTVVGQGWGAWTEDGGLSAAEDFITANKDINCIITENDQMMYGAMIAVENAQLENVDLVSTADGEQKAYDLVKEGKCFSTGENSPAMMSGLTLEVAKQVLEEGKTDFDKVIMTEAVAITKDNVEERYDFGF